MNTKTMWCVIVNDILTSENETSNPGNNSDSRKKKKRFVLVFLNGFSEDTGSSYNISQKTNH